MTQKTHNSTQLFESDQWEEIRALFDRCVELSASEQMKLLDDVGKAKPWLRNEVEALLGQKDAPLDDLRATLMENLFDLRPEPEGGSQPKFEPEQFGPHLLFHPLGMGGMAEVHLAKMFGPQGFERIIALKRILPQYAMDPAQGALFAFEAKLASQLIHPNIAQFYDYGEFDNRFFIAMEFVNGVNLGAFLARAKGKISIPLSASAYVISEVAKGLSYAHQRKDDATGEPLNIVHRDLSPRNIMLSFNGEIKLVDFGIAKASARAQFTKSGFLRGSLGYLSPETSTTQSAIDGRSDIFAISVLLYELIAGKPLFDTEQIGQLFAQIHSEDFIQSRIRALLTTETAREVLRRGLAVSPEKRFATASELYDALGALRSDFSASRLADLMGTLYQKEIDERRTIIAELKSASPKRLSGGKRILTISRTRLALLSLAVVALLVVLPFFGSRTRPYTLPLINSVLPTTEEETTVLSLCAKEAKELCSGYQLRAGLVSCLAAHSESLSPPCLKTVSKFLRNRMSK